MSRPARSSWSSVQSAAGMEISATDDERRMSFEAASQFETDPRRVCTETRDRPVEVPRVPPNERASFILQNILSSTGAREV